MLAAIVVAALLVVRRDVSATAPETATGPLFPELRAGSNDAASLEEVRRVPFVKPSGKYNVYNKTRLSDGTSH